MLRINRYLFIVLLLITGFFNQAFSQSADLKIVFIRHGEKPLKGDNLTCQGLNRALQLPALLQSKFGAPAYLFAPALALGEETKHARMFQTITPVAIKYNLPINTSYAEKDSALLARDLKARKGTVIVIWEHKAIAPIVRSLGVTSPNLMWRDDDYDSIWIVTYTNGKAVLMKDKEGLTPATACK